ncbi:MAG: hypothetical protein HY297_03505 [Thaumarchaeota archaeon]|nr:hypothetical protein [Nitrososphaerota archaeon]
MLPTATEVRVKKDGDSAKVKARTPTGLYTLKTTTEQVDSLVKGVKVPVTEY